MEEKKWCVYKHTFPDGKIYIGITNDTKRRWGNNGNEYKSNKRFMNHVRKYGWLHIRHDILENNLNKEKAYELEEYFINKYNSTNPRKGFNLTTGGSLGTEYTNGRKIIRYNNDGIVIGIYKTMKEAEKETAICRGTISLICRHKQMMDMEGCVWRYSCDPFDINNCETQPNRTIVLQLDFNKKIINKYNSMAEAAKNFTNSDASCISSALNKDTRTAYGYYWCEVSQYDIFNPKLSRNSQRKINQYDINGKYIATFNSIKEVKNIFGEVNIYGCCVGKNKTARGFQWRYYEGNVDNIIPIEPPRRVYTKINQYDLNGNFIKTWDSIKEASEIYNVTLSTICTALRGRNKTSCGYIWKYADI